MKPREYCCCAIPIVNAGIYVTLIEQFVTALTVAILSVATTHIVGASTPSFAAVVLAIICFVVAGIQALGFIGVAMERPIMFKRYMTLHAIVTVAAFAVAAAWAIISATRHSNAKDKCLIDFFATTDSTLASEGDTLCEVFPWVDVGIMGGLWVILALLHAYLFIILSSYSRTQVEDHAAYDQLNNEFIPMNKRNDPWDSRPSVELDGPTTAAPLGGHGYNHLRQESAASASDIMTQPSIQAKDSYSYPTARSPPPQSQLGRGQSQRTVHSPTSPTSPRSPTRGTAPYVHDYGYQGQYHGQHHGASYN